MSRWLGSRGFPSSPRNLWLVPLERKQDFAGSFFRIVVVHGGVRIGRQRFGIVARRCRLSLPRGPLPIIRTWLAARGIDARYARGRDRARVRANSLLPSSILVGRIQRILRVGCLGEEWWGSFVLDREEHVRVLAVRTNNAGFLLTGRSDRLVRRIADREMYYVALWRRFFSRLAARRVRRNRRLFPRQVVRSTCWYRR